MTGRDLLVLLAPAGLAAVIAGPLGWVVGPVHWWAAGVAVALSVPAAVGTFGLTRHLAARHPFGGLIGMAVGTAARLAVAVGGGMAVFLATPLFRDAVLTYWLWVMGTYLAELVAESGLLAAGLSARPAGSKG